MITELSTQNIMEPCEQRVRYRATRQGGMMADRAFHFRRSNEGNRVGYGRGTATRRSHRAGAHTEKPTPPRVYDTGHKMAISPSIIAFLGMSMRENIYAKQQSCICTRLTRAWPKMDPQEVHQGQQISHGHANARIQICHRVTFKRWS